MNTQIHPIAVIPFFLKLRDLHPPLERLVIPLKSDFFIARGLALPQVCPRVARISFQEV